MKSRLPRFHDFAKAINWDRKDNHKFIEAICQNNNPKDMVGSLATCAEREKGIKLRIVYPDSNRILKAKTGESE